MGRKPKPIPAEYLRLTEESFHGTGPLGMVVKESRRDDKAINSLVFLFLASKTLPYGGYLMHETEEGTQPLSREEISLMCLDYIDNGNAAFLSLIGIGAIVHESGMFCIDGFREISDSSGSLTSASIRKRRQRAKEKLRNSERLIEYSDEAPKRDNVTKSGTREDVRIKRDNVTKSKNKRDNVTEKTRKRDNVTPNLVHENQENNVTMSRNPGKRDNVTPNPAARTEIGGTMNTHSSIRMNIYKELSYNKELPYVKKGDIELPYKKEPSYTERDAYLKSCVNDIGQDAKENSSSMNSGKVQPSEALSSPESGSCEPAAGMPDGSRAAVDDAASALSPERHDDIPPHASRSSAPLHDGREASEGNGASSMEESAGRGDDAESRFLEGCPSEDVPPGPDAGKGSAAAGGRKRGGKDSGAEDTDCGFYYSKFNEICGGHGSIPRLIRLTEDRKRLIRSAVGEVGGDMVLKAFEAARDSDFLNGTAPRTPGHKSFRCTFDWLMRIPNLVKVIEGNYVNDGKEQLTPALGLVPESIRDGVQRHLDDFDSIYEEN